MPSTRRNKNTEGDGHSGTPTSSVGSRGSRKTSSVVEGAAMGNVKKPNKSLHRQMENESDTSKVKQMAPVTRVKRQADVEETRSKKSRISTAPVGSDGAKGDKISKEQLVSPRRSSRAAVPNSRYKDMLDPSVKLPTGTPKSTEAATPKARQQRKTKQTPPKVAATTANIMIVNEQSEESEVIEGVVTEVTQIDSHALVNITPLQDEQGARRPVQHAPSQLRSCKDTQGTTVAVTYSFDNQSVDREIINVRPSSVNSKDEPQRSLLAAMKRSKQSPINALASLTKGISSPSSNIPQIIDSKSDTETPKSSKPVIHKVPFKKDLSVKVKTLSVPLVLQSARSPANQSDIQASTIVIPPVESLVTQSSETKKQHKTFVSKVSGSKVVYQQTSDSKGRTVLSVPYKSGAVKVVNVPMKASATSSAKVVAPRVIRKVVTSNEGTNLLIKTPATNTGSISPVVGHVISASTIESIVNTQHMSLINTSGASSSIMSSVTTALSKAPGLSPNVKVVYLKGTPSSTVTSKTLVGQSKDVLSTSSVQECTTVGQSPTNSVATEHSKVNSEQIAASVSVIESIVGGDSAIIGDPVKVSRSNTSDVDTIATSEQSVVENVETLPETLVTHQNIETPNTDSSMNVSMEPVPFGSLCQVIEYKGNDKKKTTLGAGLEVSESREMAGKQTRYGRVEIPRSIAGGGLVQRFQIHQDRITPKYEDTTAGIHVSSAQTSIGTVIAQLEESHPTSVIPAQGSSHGGRVMHGYIDLSRKGAEHIETEIVEISPDLFTREVYGETGTSLDNTDIMDTDQVNVTEDGTENVTNEPLVLHNTTSEGSCETPSETIHTATTADDVPADDTSSLATTTVTSMTGLEGMTATQMGDGIIQIEGLDLASLDKNTIVTVEKMSSGEEAVVLHTEDIHVGGGEHEKVHLVDGGNTGGQQSDNFINMVQNAVSSDSPVLSPAKVVKISTMRAKSGGHTSQPIHPPVQALTGVKITPVQSYVADSNRSHSRVGSVKHVKHVYHSGARHRGDMSVEGGVEGLQQGDTEELETQAGYMKTGTVSVSTSTNTQTDDSDTDGEEPIEVHWDGENYVMSSENSPTGRRLQQHDSDTPYQELVIVQLPEGSEIKQFKVKPVIRQTSVIEEPVTQDKDGNYICVDCDHKTDKRSNWYKHRRRHLGIKPHACSKCSYRAATSSNLKRHMQIHDDIRSFHCDICGLNFRQKIHLVRHYKYKHQEKKVQCPLCDFSCTTENPDLKIHIRKRHMPLEGSMDDFTCKTCGLMTVSKKDLKQHQKFHKKGPELKLFCEHCSFVTDCMSRLRRHLCVHTKERPFQCGLCPYRASQKEHVLRHMRSQHNVEVEPRQKRSLLDIRTIVKEDNVIIPKDADAQPVIPSKYRKPDLDSDSDGTSPFEKVDFSNQDKIFACNHCSMKFARLINLYKHLYAQHALVMPSPDGNDHQCVVCDFRTSSKKNLLVHMRKHNAQDHSPPSHVYSCVLCRYINPKRRNLFQHMKKKHGIEIIMKDDGLNCFVTIDSDEGKGDGQTAIANEIALSEIVKTEEVNSETPLQIMVAEDGSTYKDQISIENIIPIEDMSEYETSSQSDQQVLVSPQIVHATVQEHEAAEAIEGLQALAEQAGILETQNIDNDMTTEIVSAEIMNDGEIAIAPTTSEGETFLQPHQVLEISGASQGYEVIEDLGGAAEEMSGGAQGVGESVSGEEREADIQLSSDQLNQLTTGDYVEINGEVYKVEIAPDNEIPPLQTV